MTENTQQTIEHNGNKNLELVKLFFQVIALLCAEIFLGMLITLMALYGVDISSNEAFTTNVGTTAGILGIPLFGITVLCALIIGAINLRKEALKQEDQLKEFQLVAKKVGVRNE
ncbi:MAG: hypothetical protein GF308_14585 [Candidatus Heimdallarchaeota archaeon]|nr:hypothetical protein [Candidatus Heimdallarchaeota archaeon]